jgi:3-methyladenine DNA glycosylase AlkD
MSAPSDRKEIADRIICELRAMANPSNVEGMSRYGISTDNTLGVPMPAIRSMAKQIGRDHQLAHLVWDSGLHEARILAALIDEPGKVTLGQMESWIGEVDSWDVCDQLCSNLFDKTIHAYQAARAWSKRKEIFVKRASYVLMAALAVHDKGAGDEVFLEFLTLIRKGSSDDRNFVKKSVNWALRQIGKRNMALHEAAIATAKLIDKQGSSAAHWIAKDALRELTNEVTIARLTSKSKRPIAGKKASRMALSTRT